MTRLRTLGLPWLTLILGVGLGWVGAQAVRPAPSTAAVAAMPPVDQTRTAAAALGASSVVDAVAPGAHHDGSIAPTHGVASQDLRALTLQTITAPAFAAQQIALTRMNCAPGSGCDLALQVPPFAPAARQHDPALAANLLTALQQSPNLQGHEVGLSELRFGADGIALRFQVKPPSTVKGRYYTDADIAKLRADTIADHMRQAGQNP